MGRASQGRYVCGIDAAVDVVGGKWKPMILWALYDHGALRFGALRREVVGVTEKVLTQQLKEMEADGIVHREVYPEVPPRVEYSMTELGEKLNAALLPLGEWGDTFMEQIVANKERAAERATEKAAGRAAVRAAERVAASGSSKRNNKEKPAQEVAV